MNVKPFSILQRSFFIFILLLNHAFIAQGMQTLTIATVAPADSPWAVILDQYKKLVEEKTKGEIKVKLMLGGALGDENEIVTKLSRGQIQGGGVSTGAMASKIPELNLLELPFLFRNESEADQVIDSTLTAEYKKLFEKRGLTLAFWSENGYRHFATRDKPILSLADLKGKKMRVQENPVHISMYKAFHASGLPLPTTEVPQALATGNIDGYDQALLYSIAAGWTKSIKHVTLSGHIYQPALISFNHAWFKKLKPEFQNILIESGLSFADKGRKNIRALNPELIDILKGENIQVHNLSNSNRKDFEEQSKTVYDDFKKQFGAEGSRLFELTQKKLQEIRK